MYSWFYRETQYPQIFLPDELERAITQKQAFRDEPVEPSKPKRESSDVWGCIVVPAPFIIILAVLPFPIEFVWVIAGVLSIAIFFSWIQNVEKVNSRHQRNIAKYEEDLRVYETERDIWLKEKAYLEIPEITRLYQLKRIAQVLESTKKPNIRCQSKTGIGERYFESYLNRHFHGKIFKSAGFYIDENHKPYQPDFIYQDGDLHIDIEIDEPYVFDAKPFSPIHHTDFLSGDTDAPRNRYFTDLKGWIVIRFAEEQVVRYPDECCQVIEQVIRFLTNSDHMDGLYRTGLQISELLKPVAKWSEYRAMQMQMFNSRQMYLQEISPSRESENTWNQSLKLESYKQHFPNVDETYKSHLDDIDDDLPF